MSLGYLFLSHRMQSASPRGFFYGLVEDIYMCGGMVSAPTEPGLGFKIDWDLIKSQHIATVA